MSSIPMVYVSADHWQDFIKDAVLPLNGFLLDLLKRLNLFIAAK